MNKSLYGGSVNIDFDENAHKYLVNSKPTRGVTTILNVLNKPALLNWGVNMAVDHIEKNIFIEGIEVATDSLPQLFLDARNAHNKIAKDAATTGTTVHQAIERWIKNMELLVEVFEPEAELAYRSFIKWQSDNNVHFEKSEEIIYSKEYDYAGTYDFICTIGGKRYMGDLKTSSGIYPAYWMQVAAYQQAVQEENPNEKFDGMVIVRCGKDGKLEVKFNDNYEGNRDAFNHCVALDKFLNGKTI